MVQSLIFLTITAKKVQYSILRFDLGISSVVQAVPCSNPVSDSQGVVNILSIFHLAQLSPIHAPIDPRPL